MSGKFFTDYRKDVSRADPAWNMKGLSAIEKDVFERDRARMKLKAIPAHRRRVLYGLERELDPDLTTLKLDDPRAYYEDDTPLVHAHLKQEALRRDQRTASVSKTAGDLLEAYPTSFRKAGPGALQCLEDGTYAKCAMRKGDILTPTPSGLTNRGAVASALDFTVQKTSTVNAIDMSDARKGVGQQTASPF